MISGGGNSASLKLTGFIDLSGQYGTGGLSVGTVTGSPNSAAFTLGGLALAAGSGVTASTVNVIDGSIALSGAGASLAASGAVTVGSPGGNNLVIAGQTYSSSGGANGSITVGAGATLSAASLAVADGSLTASGSGATVSVSGGLSLGTAGSASFVSVPYYFGNSGSLSISGGASVSVGGAITALNSFGGAFATISVSGSGSRLTAVDTLTLATQLNAQSGGTVQLGGLSLSGSSNTSPYVFVDSASSVEIGSAGGAAKGAITVDAGNTIAATGNTTLSGNIADNGTISESGGGR